MAVYTNITASEMAAFLEAQGFKPLALPVVRELTWGKRVDKGNLCLSLRVFTGINPTGQSRDKGKDAIHVVLMLRRQDGSIVPVATGVYIGWKAGAIICRPALTSGMRI